MRAPRFSLLLVILALAAAPPAGAAGPGPVVHELIRPDPRDDLAMHVLLSGDLPAAIETPSGTVAAPDADRPIPAGQRGSDATLDPSGRPFDVPSDKARFVPDEDTHRPDVLNYDDPFVPSTAPFKRLMAFDTVDSSLILGVRKPTLHPLSTSAKAVDDGSEEAFYADIVVDLAPGRRARVPSVGPGAKVLHAQLSSGPQALPFTLYADGADNWFVESPREGRARLVLELSIPREVFGGEFGDPGWSDLPAAPALPHNVAADANKVALRIGVSRGLSPRENVKRLVSYFRGFTDSAEPPRGQGDVYLDLALSRKGVCRHRAYAFLVTALGLGIPTRMVMNEAHAWVEVHDGSLWRRIDLGGAGRTLAEALSSEVPYQPPPDPFAWPPNATRGEDLAARARAASSAGGSGGGGAGGSTSTSTPTTTSTGTSTSASTATSAEGEGSGDGRAASVVRIDVADPNAHRGAPVSVRGDVRADGEPCEHVSVTVVLREARGRAHERLLGTLATGDDGTFSGVLIVPSALPLGDYDIVATTPGDSRCAPGASP